MSALSSSMPLSPSREVAMSSSPNVVQRAAALGRKVAGALSFVAPLLTRVTVGYAFYLTGKGKLEHLDTFTEYLTSLHVPMAAQQAPFLAGFECVGGVLLALGLFTRLAGAGLSGMMVVALITAEWSDFVKSWDPAFDKGPMDITPWVFLMLLLWVVLYGPGPVSLDKGVSKLLKLDEEQPPA